MEELKKLVIKEINKRYNERELKINTTEGLKQALSFEGKTYKGSYTTQREKLKKFLMNRRNKDKETQLNQIEEVNKAKAFGGELIITLEWTKSRMWGSNPKAYTNYGFEGESIGGCGYCKTSTATAEALNSDLRILKLLYKKKNEYLKTLKKDMNQSDIHRECLGYGAGYNVLPSFEGGVGVSSHINILQNVGLNMRSVTDTPTTNVYIVTKGVRK